MEVAWQHNGPAVRVLYNGAGSTGVPVIVRNDGPGTVTVRDESEGAIQDLTPGNAVVVNRIGVKLSVNGGGFASGALIVPGS